MEGETVSSLQNTEEQIKKALSSPKASPLAIAIGSALWKAIAFWSNVDFILSVREERVAMILEALLDWGWIVIVVAGLLWAFFASKTSTDKTQVNGGMAIAAGVLCFMGGLLITTQSNSTVPNVMTAWASSFQDCVAQVDTSKLVAFEKKYRLVLVCGISNPKVDPFEDTQIALSVPFRLTGAQANTVDAPFGKMSEVVDQLPPGTAFGVWHSVALLPISVDISEIKRPSDFEKRGGMLITDPKVGGFQGSMGKPMPTPVPTQSPTVPVDPKNKSK